jgi:hypothetical protein
MVSETESMMRYAQYFVNDALVETTIGVVGKL